MLASLRAAPTLCLSKRRYRNGFCCRASTLQSNANGDRNSTNNNGKNKKKIVVVGSGWAGLGAAHHLSKQVLHLLSVYVNFDFEFSERGIGGIFFFLFAGI